jgi:hypothetical protein
MDDLTKDLWQGVGERVNDPERVEQPPLPGATVPTPAAPESAWREFLVSRKLAGVLALACVLGLIGIVEAHPFASPRTVAARRALGRSPPDSRQASS